MRITRLLLPSAVALLALAPSAHAACVTSTPSSVQFADNPFDGGELAPEITTVTASVNGTCGYSVDPALTESLINGDGVFIYIDVDGNLATGDPVFAGADVSVGTIGVTGPEAPPRLARWTGTTYDFANSVSVGAVSNGGFAAAIDQLGIASGATTRFRIGTIWRGAFDDYFDFAPDAPGTTIPLPVIYSTVAPPPAPTPTPAPSPAPSPSPVPTTPAASDPPVAATASCRVPKVKGLRLTRAEDKILDAGCDLADDAPRRFSTTVKRGRAIGTSPAAGSRTSRPVRIFVSKGRRKARARSASSSTLAALQVRVRLGLAAR